MSELILGLIIIVLIGERIYFQRQIRAEQKDYMKALMAKGLHEFVDSEIIEKDANKSPEPPPEFVPMEEASDELFKKYLENNNGRQDQN